MEQLREEARRRKTGLERWRVERMTELDKDEEMQNTHMVFVYQSCVSRHEELGISMTCINSVQESLKCPTRRY